MKRILPICLLLLLSGLLSAQSVEELQLAWQQASEVKSKLKFGERLAEKLLSRAPDEALQYASEAYQLAESIDDKKHLAITAYLLGKIQIRRQARAEALTHFKQALAFAKSNDDTNFSYRCLKKLISLHKRQRQYREALGYAEEGLKLLVDAKQIELPTEEVTKPIRIDSVPAPAANAQIKKLQQEKEKLREEIASLMFEREEQLSFDLSARPQNTVIQPVPVEVIKEESTNWWPWLLAFVSSLLGAALFWRFYESGKAKELLAEQNRIIESERQRSEELLLNIVPAPVAKDMREHRKTIAKKFEFTTVLFADFKNFAAVHKLLEPEQLVASVDHCFKAFDQIIAKYDNIEKIKTIGDTYLCATGLTTRETAPINLVQAALEMQDFLNKYKKAKMARSEPFFEGRIGIHTGEVVAGVVGKKKFAYDIFGETVDVAAKIQQYCAVGKVNLSADTYRLVKYSFDCIIGGSVLLPEGQPIDMYYVHPEQEEVLEEEAFEEMED